MGFFRNILNKTVEQITQKVNRPDAARPVENVVQKGFKDVVSNIFKPWKEKIDKKQKEKEEKQREKERKQKEKEEKERKKKEKESKMVYPDRGNLAKIANKDKEHFQNLLFGSNDRGDFIYRFELKTPIATDYEFSGLLRLCVDILSKKIAINDSDLIIFGCFVTKQSGTAGFSPVVQWRALSPLFPSEQSIVYASTAGIEIAEYQSGMVVKNMTALEFKFVVPNYDRERGV